MYSKPSRTRVLLAGISAAVAVSAGCTDTSKADAIDTTTLTFDVPSTTTGTIPGSKMTPRVERTFKVNPFSEAQIVCGEGLVLSSGLSAIDLVEDLKDQEHWTGSIVDNTPVITPVDDEMILGKISINTAQFGQTEGVTLSKNSEQLGSAEKFTSKNVRGDDIVFARYYREFNPRITDFTAEYLNVNGKTVLTVDVDPDIDVFVIDEQGKLQAPSSETIEQRRVGNGYRPDRDVLTIDIADKSATNYVQGVVVHRKETNATSVITTGTLGVTY